MWMLDGELENLRSKKNKLEEEISVLEISVLDSSLKLLQSEQRHFEDEVAQLHRQREDILNIAHHEKKKRRELDNRVNQRRSKLKSMETEEDLDSFMANLINSVANLNVQLFQCY